jgi:hypothetical protein
MKNAISLTTFIIALAVFFLACENTPNPAETPISDQDGFSGLAKATTTTDNSSIPFDISIFIPCANGGVGETVELSGRLHILIHITTNDNNFVIRSHFQPQNVSGVGLTTGDTYRGTGVTQNTQTGSFINGQATVTFVNNFLMIGQGPGNNFTVHQNVHMTLNANGDATASVDNFRTECK